jgi:hypothetical protein
MKKSEIKKGVPSANRVHSKRFFPGRIRFLGQRNAELQMDQEWMDRNHIYANFFFDNLFDGLSSYTRAKLRSSIALSLNCRSFMQVGRTLKEAINYFVFEEHYYKVVSWVFQALAKACVAGQKRAAFLKTLETFSLNCPDHMVRTDATDTLARFAGKEALPTLLKAMRDPSDSVRYHLIFRFYELKRFDLIKKMFYNDHSESVVENAKRHLFNEQ